MKIKAITMNNIKRPTQAALRFLFLVIIINIVLYGLAYFNKQQTDIYLNLAVSIMIAWIIFLIAYYVWAIGFYNVNLGWTDEDWAAKGGMKDLGKEEAGTNMTAQLAAATSTDPSTKEPDGNPNNGESLGLPVGTVRATIALTLLVAGLSMAIASFSFKNNYPLNALFIDHFEFFKTGFLMMIAFYFGAKGLDIIRNSPNAGSNPKTDPPSANDKGAADDPADPNSPVAAPQANKIPIDPAARG